MSKQKKIPKRVYIAMGSNQAYRDKSPWENMVSAVHKMSAISMNVRQCSRLWRSVAWPDPAGPEYVNGVIEVETELNPFDLMEELHQIEMELGRKRSVKNAPRTLDLDILDYGGEIIRSTDGLCVPHIRLAERAFVLLPLADIAPDWAHPETGLPLTELISALSEGDKKTCTPIANRSFL